MSCEHETTFTVADYLGNKVKFDVTISVLIPILTDRGLDRYMPLAALSDDERTTLRLCYADLLKWFVLGPSKVNNVTDSDNGWSHAGGGYELSDEDISRMKSEANAIYEELEPGSVFAKKSTFKVNSFGVMRSNRQFSGDYLPHIIK